MEEFLAHLEFAKILGLVSLLSILITGTVYYIFKDYEKYRMFKYIPGLIFILFGTINLISMGFSIPSVDELNRLLIIVMAIVGGFLGLLAGLIIGIVEKKKKVD